MYKQPGYHLSEHHVHVPSSTFPRTHKKNSQGFTSLQLNDFTLDSTTMASHNQDPFDDVLNLEDQFYSEGYQQGVADGERAGRIEGRSFGIEKGFEKFVEAGRLYGKSIVWANRLTPTTTTLSPSSSAARDEGPKRGGEETLKALPGGGGGGAGASSRLGKNIVTLHALVEPDTLSTDNTDEAVQDFDDRVKRAQGKARVIERQVGEDGSGSTATVAPSKPRQQRNRENGGAEGSVGGGGGSKTGEPQPQATSSSLAEDLVSGF